MSDFLKKTKKGFNSLVGKTQKAIESGKASLSVQQYKTKISTVYKEIGKIVFEKHTKGISNLSFSDDDISSKIKEIELYQTKIEELEKKE